MYFVDDLGQLQLTGSGLFVALVVGFTTLVVLFMVLKKIFSVGFNYYRMKKIISDYEEDMDNLPMLLEEYYQKRKIYEKGKGIF